MQGRRVAVVGLVGGGKTSLITSLISHLCNHDPNKLRVNLPKNDTQALSFNWKPNASGEDCYEEAMSKLRIGNWPQKTLTPNAYRFTVNHGSWTFKRHLTISDIPGERLSDLDMMLHTDIYQWGSEIVKKFTRISTIQSTFRIFKDLYNSEEIPGDENSFFEQLKTAYRNCLTQLLLEQRFPFITPSSFLADATGHQIPDDITESGYRDWCDNHAVLGLSNDKPVIPIPRILQGTKIGDSLDENFHVYKKQVVEPSLNSLIYAHDVFVLIDVARILEEGPLWLDTNVELLRSLSKLLNHGNWFSRNGRKLWNKVVVERIGIQGKQLSRIHLLASQIDRVHMDDRDNVAQLLEQISTLSFPLFAAHGGVVKTGHFAAFKSNESHKNKHELISSGDGKQLDGVTSVPTVPNEFPEKWKDGDFIFPVADHPLLPSSRSLVPDHINLESIVNPILEW